MACHKLIPTNVSIRFWERMSDTMDNEKYIERLRHEKLYKYNGELSEEIKKYALELIRICSRIGLDNVSFIQKRVMPPYFLEFESGRWKLSISVDTYLLTNEEFELIETLGGNRVENFYM